MRIKNWSNFQHFKDRRPPWIKLYREILDDIEWHQLDPLASKVLVMCWLLASENDGVLPDMKTLAFRLRMSEKQTSDCISKLNHWLEQDDINLISSRYQDDALEKETKKETKKDKEKATLVAAPEGVSSEIWDSFVKHRKAKRAAITELVMAYLQEQADLAGWTLENVLKEICTRNWQSFKAEWIAPKQSFAQQAADVARTTVPARNSGPDTVLLQIEADRKNAKPMPESIRQQINQVLRKV